MKWILKLGKWQRKKDHVARSYKTIKPNWNFHYENIEQLYSPKRAHRPHNAIDKDAHKHTHTHVPWHFPEYIGCRIPIKTHDFLRIFSLFCVCDTYDVGLFIVSNCRIFYCKSTGSGVCIHVVSLCVPRLPLNHINWAKRQY